MVAVSLHRIAFVASATKTARVQCNATIFVLRFLSALNAAGTILSETGHLITGRKLKTA